MNPAKVRRVCPPKPEYFKPSWAETSRPVYVFVSLEDESGAKIPFTKDILNKVVQPLLDAFERSPLFFAKYGNIIQSVTTVEMRSMVLFKTLLDKPQYFKNPLFLKVTYGDLIRSHGSACGLFYRFVLDKMKGYFGRDEKIVELIGKFMRDGLISDRLFDSESLLVSLQLIAVERHNRVPGEIANLEVLIREREALLLERAAIHEAE
jgi:hypothetical protein